MRVELKTDEDASRALHQPVMHFVVKLDEGEAMTRDTSFHVRALAHSASRAWDVLHAEPWEGTWQ